jgi:hypothetical protein
MRKILCYAIAVALAALAYGADSAATTKKPVARKAASRVTPKATARKSPAKGSSKGSARRTVRRTPAVTWRNRQMTPSPERYKEIQDALVAKGYLRPEDAGTGWNQASMDALKRFQGGQNIEASGKINSLSLIALGLGPKHDTSPAKVADTGNAQDR